MIKVMIVDDHPIVTNGIRHLIDAQSDMRVAGTATCGEECKKMLCDDLPDVLLLDINLPDINGMELCKFVHEKYPLLKIIALTSFREFFYVRKMLHNGAKGYILKNAMPDEITEGIRSVHRGEEFLSEEINTAFSVGKEKGKFFLTIRETELLAFIIDGYTNKEIADKMFLGVETVNSYRKNLLLKLGVKNTAAMVKLAIEQKLI
jgi:DNA-binding NarL/FixJ family response regulator